MAKELSEVSHFIKSKGSRILWKCCICGGLVYLYEEVNYNRGVYTKLFINIKDASDHRQMKNGKWGCALTNGEIIVPISV